MKQTFKTDYIAVIVKSKQFNTLDFEAISEPIEFKNVTLATAKRRAANEFRYHEEGDSLGAMCKIAIIPEQVGNLHNIRALRDTYGNWINL